MVSPPAGAPSQSNLALVRRSRPSILPADWGLICSPIEGSTVAVFGCGCVGLSCVNAASLAGASRVFAVDVNPAKEAWARKFGATDFVNPLQLPEGKRIQDYLVELTDGGLDYTFDATGNVSHYESERLLMVDANTPYRSTSCVLLSRHATRDGASRLSSVLQLPGKRFLHDREFGQPVDVLSS